MVYTINRIIDRSDNREDEAAGRDGSAYTRFKVACKAFLHVTACEEHPVVLFIDDIQWMDEGSRELLCLLLQDSGLKNTMLILAYREEESEKVGNILVNDSSRKSSILDIHLGTLFHDEVEEMVCAWMGTTSSNAVVELSQLVAVKTDANPLHFVQFMECIQEIGLLYYDCETLSWIFDVDTIQRALMISETLADLLTIKVQRLSINVQEVLKIAAMIGFEFSKSVVVDVIHQFRLNLMSAVPEDTSLEGSLDRCGAMVASCINVAMKDGFIAKTKGGDYIFSHDKLQASFQSMLSVEEEGLYHLRIGETFLGYGDSGSDGDSAYHAAVHLNFAPAFIEDTESQVRLATLNLKAARTSEEKSAFAVTAGLLRHGLSLIPEESKWENYFDLTFEFTELLAQVELIVGNFHECKELTREALAREKSTEMLINSYWTNVEVRMAANDMRGAVVATRQTLHALGIQVPRRKPGVLSVFVKTIKVKRMIGKKTDEDILSLPRMTDPLISAATKLLQLISIFLSLQDEDVQGVYYAFLAVALTLRHGLSPYSPSAFVCYGVTELSLGNHDRVYRFGKLALRMLDESECKDTECATVGIALTMLTHWKEPLSDAPDRLMKAVKTGFSVGDNVYGTIFLTQICTLYLNFSMHLEALEALMRDAYQRMRDFSSEDAVLMWAQPGFQHVLNLRAINANWKEIVVLTGEIMNEMEYKRTAAEDKNQVLLAQLGSFKAETA